MKVLIYSPEEDFSAQLASLRCLAALDVDRQCDYSTAREAFEEHRHPLVLVEASSSDGDGLSLCRKIRAVAAKDRHVIVMIAPNDAP